MFDQRVDPKAVLDHVELRGRFKQSPTLRLASADEIDADPDLKKRVKKDGAGRWMAFRPVLPLPGGSTISVVVKAGMRSAEGPLTTREPQRFKFRTHGPLKLTNNLDDDLAPNTSFRVEFSNPLDGDAFDSSWVAVEPEVANQSVSVWRNSISIDGRTRPRTTYHVTLGAGIRDVFGQTLGRPKTLSRKVGAFPKWLGVPGPAHVVLHPGDPPQLIVKSINHDALDVRLLRVEPRHWRSHSLDQLRSADLNRDVQPRVEPTRIPVHAQPDEIAETRIDLGPALKNGRGHVFAIVEPAEPPEEDARVERRRRRIVRWVQVTRIGLNAIQDEDKLIAWVTELDGAAPIMGAELRFVDDPHLCTTDAQGLATLPLPSLDPPRELVLVATVGDDVAFLPCSGLVRTEPRGRLAWYVFTDRPLYRPGDEVHFKGWVREIQRAPIGDVRLPEAEAATLTWTAVDSRGRSVAQGSATFNDLFGFDGAFRLPEDMALGAVELRFAAEGIGAPDANREFHTVRVEEYRRPEYEVLVNHDGRLHVVGGAALITARARYFSGGGLPNTKVDWIVASRTASFRPPGWDAFSFGGSLNRSWGADEITDQNVQRFKGCTDSEGVHRLRVALVEARLPVCTALVATATFENVNRQTWTESTQLLVHPATVCVGLRSARRFVRAGQPLTIEAIALTPEGKVVSNRPIGLRACRVEWRWVRGAWREEEHDPQDCSLTSGLGSIRWEFATTVGGTYRITAIVKDEEGRSSLSELTLWATGGAGRWRPGEAIELVADLEEYHPGDTAEILVTSPFASTEGIMTVRRQGVAETQRFRIAGPTHVLRVPIREEHVPNVYVAVELIAAPGTDPLPGTLTPDADCFAAGKLELKIPPRARTLVVSAVPRERELKPGGETVIDLELRNADGRSIANGDVAVAVIDEAVLALLPEALRDPVESFYRERRDEVMELRSRDLIRLGPRIDPTAKAPGTVRGVIRDEASGKPLSAARVRLEGVALSVLSGSDGAYVLGAVPAGAYTVVVDLVGFGTAEERIVVASGTTRDVDFMLSARDRPFYGESGYERYDDLLLSGSVASGEAGPSIRLRTEFAARAVFVASVRTDHRGRAEVPVRVPDNLTRYRVIAVAAAGAQLFGKGESTITAALPLMARPSLPRFLNLGDAPEMPVVVQNRESTAVVVDVAVRAVNLAFPEGQGLRVEVPAHGRVELRFPARTVHPGSASVQVAAFAASEADAAQVTLPVWTPATTEAFATYGELDEGTVAVPVAVPGGTITAYGGLQVTTSSTAVQALTDAILYLTSYPFECAEQIASRVIAVASLRDVLTAFDAEGLPAPEAMIAAVNRDIARLQSMQSSDGGFSFWGGRRDDSWPYVSIHVAHALARAEKKGFAVPTDMQSSLLDYLGMPEVYSADYPKGVRTALKAYSLYVRMLVGDRTPADAQGIFEAKGPKSLPLEAAGWLLSVLSGQPGNEAEVTALRRHLANRVSETAATAQFTVSYGDGDYLMLYSSGRADAVILDALIADQPKSGLIPKLVRGLLARRQRGRWLNTQENAFVLLALDRYFNTYEGVTPDFAARVWLGNNYAGGHYFRGRSTARHEVKLPMAWLTERGGTENVILGKSGAGRLYYRIGMRYAPAEPTLEAAEHGFSVERTYHAADDPDDVRRDENGTWHIRAGARVRVKLGLAAMAPRYHVALVDPLPAGFEALNRELAGQEVPDGSVEDEGQIHYEWRWPWSRWYDHVNLRDERVEVFTTLLSPGTYSYTYFARATTLGEFVVPPPKAEEMYQPETFGRGPGDRVVIRE
jgi:uncharacterized protein YfaS (alpha-2-macroglobulin family)